MMSNTKRFLKNILTTTSAISIIAGVSSNAVGVGAIFTTNNDEFILQSAVNINGPDHWSDHDKLNYGGNHQGITGGKNNIKISKISLFEHKPGVLTVVNNTGDGISTASISQINVSSTSEHRLNISLFKDSTLTLDGAGESYLGLGNINATHPGQGIVNVLGALKSKTKIGNEQKVAEVHFNLGGDEAVLNGTIISNNITINNADTIVLNRLITSNVTFHANHGKLRLSSGMHGNINFNNKNSSVILTEDTVLNGNIDSTCGGNGSLIFLGPGRVTGSIGSIYPISKLVAQGPGVIILNHGTQKIKNIHLDNRYAVLQIESGGKGSIQGNIHSISKLGGQIEFLGSGHVSGTIGEGNPLGVVHATGAGDVIFDNSVRAAMLRIASDNAKIYLNHLHSMTGNIIFAANANIIIKDGGTIKGKVDARYEDLGTLHFSGNGIVTGSVGSTQYIHSIKLTGDHNKLVTFDNTVDASLIELNNGAIISLKDNTFVDQIIINHQNSHIKIGNDKELKLSGKEHTNITGGNNDIVFSNANSRLKFCAEAGDDTIVTINTVALSTENNDAGHVFLLADGDNARPNPTKSLLIMKGKALGREDATLRLVTIAGDNKVRIENEGINAVTIDIKGGSTLEYIPSKDVSMNKITFANKKSHMILKAQDCNRIFTLNSHIDPGVHNTGVISLDSSEDKIVMLTSQGGNIKTIGTNIHQMHALNIIGNSTSIITNQVNLLNVKELNITNGAALKIQASTILPTRVTIGNNNGAGRLIMDSAGKVCSVLYGKSMILNHSDSLLKFTNSTNNGNSIIKLNGSIGPSIGYDVRGRVEINSSGSKTLNILSDSNESLGTNNSYRLKELIFSGNQNIVIGSKIFSKKITLNSSGNITLNNEVNLDTEFSTHQNVISFLDIVHNNSNITLLSNARIGNIIFREDARVNIGPDKKLWTNNIMSCIGKASEIIFSGTGALMTDSGKSTFNFNTMKLGNKGSTVTLGSGYYNINNVVLMHSDSKTIFQHAVQLTGSINNGIGAKSELIFLGHAKVTGVIGSSTHPVGSVTLQGSDNILLLGDSVNVNNLNGTLVNNSQTLRFINSRNITIRGLIGNVYPFKTIEFGGEGEVKFNDHGNLHAPLDCFKFLSNNEVSTNNFDIAGSTLLNLYGGNDNKITVNVGQTLSGKIGKSKIDTFGVIHVAKTPNNIEIILKSSQVFAGLTSENKYTNLTFNRTNGSSISYIGKNNQKIHNVNFIEDGTVYGAVHAHSIDVHDNKTATFYHDRFDANLKMHGIDTRVNFLSRITINNSTIEGNLNSYGILNFQHGAILNANIGTNEKRIGSITFSGDTDIDSDVHSDSMMFLANTLNLQNNVTFNGDTQFCGTKILLGKRTLMLRGGKSMIFGTTEINTNIIGLGLGHIRIGDTGNIILSGIGNTLIVNLDDATESPVNGKTLKLITTEPNGKLDLDLSQIIVNATAPFSKWITSIHNGELVVTQISQLSEAIKVAIEQQQLGKWIMPEFFDAIESTGKNIAFSDFMLQLNTMNQQSIADALVKTTKTTINNIENATFMTLSNIHSIVNNRMFNTTNVVNLLAPPSTKNSALHRNTIPQNDAAYSMSSSSNQASSHYGSWAMPSYSKSIQKQHQGSPGYIATSYGATIGYDSISSNHSTFGIACSTVFLGINHKDLKSDDTTNIKSYLLSSYGTHNLTTNCFFQGIFSIGVNTYDNHENRRISNSTIQQAHGKYSTLIVNTEVLGGYNHVINEQLLFSPIFGLNYNRVNAYKYHESTSSSLTLPLLDVSKQEASNKVNIIGGIKLTYSPMTSNNITIRPEAHLLIKQDIITKGVNVSTTLSGINAFQATLSTHKRLYNIGAGINTISDSMEYGIVTDTYFSTKLMGVQGAVRLSVRF